MNIAEVSVKRPVFAIMMTAALIVLGAVSYESLGLDLMPKTDAPVVSVQANLPGASAEEIETTITKRIEEAVNTISGIDELRASSDQGNSRVTINFTLERDIESATQDVRDKLAQIVNQFPRDTRPLQITKMDPDAQPIFGFAVFGPRAGKELTEIAEKRVKQELETVKDVGSVGYNGERKREIQLLLNADRLNAYGLTVDQVRIAVERQNVEIPGGQFTAGPADVALRTMGRIKNVEDFNRIVISYRADGSVITFADVGRVQDTTQEVRSATRLSGTPAIGVQVRKQSGTNTVEVVDRVQERLQRIQAQLPQDIQISIGNDQSRFIRRSFEDIKLHLILGGLLASVVVFLFIRNLRVTFIAALAIPTSIIGTFTFMKIAGFTLNNMTMLALSLATGIVIDDAIVVLENIFRFVEEKHVTPKEAAADATKEIGLAVMATTLSLVVIFVPVAFMTGQIGRYFYSFGLTSAAAILLSMFVSFTLTPALCAMWLKPGDAKSDHSTTKSSGVYAAIDRVYGKMLEWSLGHRAVMIGIAGVVVLSAAFLYPYVGKELVPDDDQGEFSINVRLPRGTSYQRTEEFIQPIEKDVLALPALQRVMQNVNSGFASFNITMTPLEERKISQQQLMIQARQMLRKYQGARISVSGGTDISGASTGGGGGGPGGGGRRRRRLQPPEHPHPGPGHRAAPGVHGAADGPRSHHPRRRRRGHQLRADAARAAHQHRPGTRGRSRREHRYARQQPAHARRRRGDIGVQGWRRSVQGAAPPGRTVPHHRRHGRSARGSRPGRRGPHGQGQRRRAAEERLRSGIDRPLQPPAAHFGERQPARACRSAKCWRNARLKVEELHLKAGLPGRLRRERAHAGRGVEQFHHRARACGDLHLHGARLAVQQLHPPAHDHDVAAAQPAGRPAGADGLRHDHQRLQRHRLDDAVRRREEEFNPAGGLHEHAARARHGAARGADRAEPRPPAADSDDDIAIVAGMVPIAFGKGAGAGSRASMAFTILGGQMLCLLLTLLVTPVVYSYFDDLREWSPAASFRRILGRTPKARTRPDAAHHG